MVSQNGDYSMAKKKRNQLPSGNIRLRASYYDENHVRHMKSFTAPTRAIAEAMMEEWQAEHSVERRGSMTVLDSVQRYIQLKEGVLSPSTIRGYTGIVQSHIAGSVIGSKDIEKLDSAILQRYISDLSRRVSPKTVRNAYGLLSSAVLLFRPDFRPTVTLPQKETPALYCPSDEDVKKLLAAISGTELEKAVLLAAFGPLRRGEISPLTADDLHGNILTVNKSMVRDRDNYWHIKTTKTASSIRSIMLPDFVVERLPKEGRLCNLGPDSITHNFVRTIKDLNLPHFRFHDLRHYSASMMHALGIPDIYIQSRGGWASNNILRAVYTNVIDSEQRKQDDIILDHFKTLMQ